MPSDAVFVSRAHEAAPRLTEYYDRQNGNLRADKLPWPLAEQGHKAGPSGSWRCGNVPLGACRLEKLEQMPVDRLVAGDDAALVQHAILAVGVAHIAACLAQDDDAGGEVPGPQIALPEAVEPAGRGPGQVERSGAHAPHPGGCRHDGAGAP